MDDYISLYEEAERKGLIDRIKETDSAEKAFSEIIAEIKAVNPELAEKVDEVAGRIARAYSIEGFKAGLKHKA